MPRAQKPFGAAGDGQTGEDEQAAADLKPSAVLERSQAETKLRALTQSALEEFLEKWLPKIRARVFSKIRGPNKDDSRIRPI